MQFIETARNIYKAAMTVAVKLPKRYTFYFGQSIYTVARDGYRHVKAANAIYPTNAHEAQMRRDFLIRAACDFDYLLSELDVARSFDKSDVGNVIPLVDLIIYEQKLISKLKASDAKRYRDLPNP